MFGLGGIFVEVLKDVAFRVHPITTVDAADMVRAVRAFPILAGARGNPAVDLAALETTLLRLNQLVTVCPSIRELDLNPCFAADKETGCLAVDARILLA